MPYHQFTQTERVLLSGYLRAGFNQTEIARLLGKHKSTISRQLSNNPAPNKIGYDARIAHINAKLKRISANQRFRKIEQDNWLRDYIKKKLKLKWSPDQIAGRLKRVYKRTIIVHETIYQYIYKVEPELIKHLRFKKSKYRKRYGTGKRITERKANDPKRRIWERPEEIEERSRLGDFEGDLVDGVNHSGYILTHVDRRSGYLLADKLKQAKAKIIKEITIKRFNQISEKKRKSITYDNGQGFADWEVTEKKIKVMIFFANPYHYWERGTNENTNGLLRQFFPKKSSFKEITQQSVDKAVKLINNRPRKRLNYLTPYEVFMKSCTLD